MPTLYYVPMIHTPQELGSLKNAFLAVQTKAYGEKGSHERMEAIERYWQEVERRMQLNGLYRPESASRLHVFVDGLPNTEESLVKKIVEELISQEIPAYIIIKTLLENGAAIHGTENPELLLEEHRYWTEISQGKTPDPEIAQRLLRSRDQYIAEHIISVVPDEEFAILFIGRSHDVISKLHKLSNGFILTHL